MSVLGLLVVTFQLFSTLAATFDEDYICVSGTPGSDVLNFDGTYKRQGMFNNQYLYRDTSSNYNHYFFYSNETVVQDPSAGQCISIQLLDVTASNCWCFDIYAPGDNYFCEFFAPVNTSETYPTNAITYYNNEGTAYTNFTVTAGQCESEFNATAICASGTQTDRPLNVLYDGTYDITDNYTWDGVGVYKHREYPVFFWFTSNATQCSKRLGGSGWSCWCFATQPPSQNSSCNLLGAVYNISTGPELVSTAPPLLGWRDWTGFDLWTNFSVSIGECDSEPTGIYEPNANIQSSEICTMGPSINGTWNGTYTRVKFVTFNSEYIYALGTNPSDWSALMWLTQANYNQSCGGIVNLTAAPDAQYCWCFDTTETSSIVGILCKIFTPVVDFSYTPFNPQYPWYDTKGNNITTFTVTDGFCPGDTADPTMAPVTPDPTVADPMPTVATGNPTMMPSFNPTATRNPSTPPTVMTDEPTYHPTVFLNETANNDSPSIFKNGLFIFALGVYIAALNV